MAMTSDQYRTEAENALTNAKKGIGNVPSEYWSRIAAVYTSLYALTKDDVTP